MVLEVVVVVGARGSPDSEKVFVSAGSTRCCARVNVCPDLSGCKDNELK